MQKRSIFIITILIFSFYLVGVNKSASAATEPFKVLTYNIEESGKNPDWINVIKEENPDIVIFVETGSWDDNNNQLLDLYCQEFNDYFTGLGENLYSCATTQNIEYETSGEAIMSRFPIVSTNQIPLVTLDDGTVFDVSHDFFDVELDLGDFNTHIVGAHLKCCSGNPENEAKRNKQQEGIINYMDNLGDVPIMYMGDLNSFSPVDTEDSNLAPDRDDLGVGPMTMMIRPSDPTYGQYSSTIHTWIDVFREVNPTDPGYTYGHQANNLDGRIDFITFNQHFPLEYVVSSTVGDTASADTGSDHYTVDATVDIAGSGGSDDTTPPSQVTGLTATTISSTQIDLNWDANIETDMAYYKIYRDSVYVAQVSDTVTSYSDTGLEASTTYTYEVSAVDTSGNEGQKSDAVSATTESGSSSGSYMYVLSIDWDQDYIRGRNPYYRLDAFVTVVDNNGNTLSGVSVTIDWSFPDGSIQTMTATTDSSGVATFTADPADTGTHTVTIVDLAGTLTYDSSQNIESSDSYTIT